MSSGWKAAREKATLILQAGGKISRNHVLKEREACSLLGIRYPDGTRPKKKSQARAALKAWCYGGHLIVAKPKLRWQEFVDESREQHLNNQALKSACRTFTRQKKKNNPRVWQEANTDAFLASYEWRQIRMQALKRDGARCCCCGATPADGRVRHVDHIKPRKHFPQLALDLNNLQVLCDVCNHGKGNWDQTDWREDVIGAKLRVIK